MLNTNTEHGGTQGGSTDSPTKEGAVFGKVKPPKMSKKPLVTGVTAVTAPHTPDPYLLDELDGFVRRRVDLTPAQQTAVCLWIAHTYIYERFKNTPKLFGTAIRHGLGKSELLETVSGLSRNGIKRQGSTTESAISRMFETYGHLTLCLDQLDGVLWDNNKLANLLIDGFEVGAIKEMSEAKGKNYVPKAYVIGFPQAMGMIGDLPNPALVSRCITIRMQPADPERQKELFISQSEPLVDKAKLGEPLPHTVKWRKRLAAELGPQGEILSKRHWPAPCKCDPRTEMMWQPLFAVAEHFGGKWPHRARRAFVALVDANEAKELDEVRFLRQVVSRLPVEGLPLLTPDELRKIAGPFFEAKEFSTDQQGKWLGKVGAGSRSWRWKERAHPEGKTAPWRAFVVAEIREAARKWQVTVEAKE